MYPATKRTLGTIGLAVILLASLCLGAVAVATPAGHAAIHAGTAKPLTIHPPLGPATTVTVSGLTSLPSYTALSFLLWFNVSVTGPNVENWTNVTVLDQTSQLLFTVVPATEVTATEWKVNVSSLIFTCTNPTPFICSPSYFAPTDHYLFTASQTVWNGTAFAKGTEATGTFVIISPLTAKWTNPAAGQAIVTAPITLFAAFTGYFIGSVNASVYASSTSTIPITVVNMITTPGGVMESATAWSPAVAGTYYLVLTVSAAYTTLTVAENVTVFNSGGTVYVNTSHYNNATLFPGLSGPVSGTILLLVGLIIGMIVAWFIGRAMYAPKAAAPAQPWTTTQPANQCSVCGKTFGSEDELKEHQKTEHGMT